MKKDSPAATQQLCTTLPLRTHDKMAWLRENAGYSTRSQIIQKGVDILFQREQKAYKERGERPVEYKPWRAKK